MMFYYLKICKRRLKPGVPRMSSLTQSVSEKEGPVEEGSGGARNVPTNTTNRSARKSQEATRREHEDIPTTAFVTANKRNVSAWIWRGIMFEPWLSQIRPPLLTNLGDTCYMSSLFQCLNMFISLKLLWTKAVEKCLEDDNHECKECPICI